MASYDRPLTLDVMGTPDRHLGMKIELLELARRDREIVEFLSVGCMDGLWYWDIDHPDSGWISPEFLARLGYSAGTASSFSQLCDEFLHPDDLQQLRANCRSACHPGWSLDQQLRCFHKNGSTVWMHSRGILVRDDDGNPSRILVTHRDITEFKRMEQEVETKAAALRGASAELERRERELQFIFDSLPVRIWYKDDKSRILRLNQPAAESMKLTVEEAEGQKACEFGGDTGQRCLDQDLQILSSGRPISEIREEPGANGAPSVWTRVDKIPYFDRKTGQRTILVVKLEVTELKSQQSQLSRLNAELEIQRQHYIELYRNTPAMMHSINENGDIVEVSNLWLEELGYERAEVIGRKSVEFMSEASKKYAWDVAIPAFWRDGYCKDIPYQFIRKDGSVMDVDLSATLDDEAVTGLKRSLGVLVDVSEKNAAFREIEAKNTALEQANENMERFIHSAAHDLREPLRKIQVFGDFLQQDYRDRLDADGQHFIDTMTGGARRMDRLIQDLLAYSHICSRPMEKREVELSALVDGAVEDLAGTISDAGAIVSHDVAQRVVGDPDMLGALFRHLLVNAIKFRHEARPPVIRISVRPDPAGNALLCTVTDNGIGFNPTYGWKMFEPFTRLHDAGIADGSGLGLAVCRRICERHQWTIRADPAPEHGTVVTVSIPKRSLVRPERS
ncbi:MAG: PAS domain S-box protein [Rhodomicrobiaceae bacterium]